MIESLAGSLTWLGATAFRWSAVVFLLFNGVAVAAFWISRDRRLVNRFTSPLVAVNLLLLGTGLALPALTYVMKLVVQMVTLATDGGASIPPS